MRLISSLALALPLLALTSGCPALDLEAEVPGAVIACASGDDCPAGQVCGVTSRLCFVPGRDAVAPTATVVSVEPATLFPGAAAVVVIDVDEALAVPPRLTIGGTDGGLEAVLTAGDHRLGDTRFTFAFAVSATETRATLDAQASLVDLSDNATDAPLPPFTVDVVGPALGDGAVVASLDRVKSHARDGDALSVAVTFGEADAAVVSAALRQGGVERAAFSVVEGVIAPLTLQGLGEGELTVEVRARDAFGNVATGTSNAIPVDLVPPTLRLEDLLLGGAPVVERLVTSTAVSIGLRAGAGGGDVLTWCVDGDIVAASGCDDDADFRPAADAAGVVLAVARGVANLRVVGRDRAFHEGVVEFSLGLLVEGEASATVAIAPPEGQSAVKVGDALAVTGTTLPGAQVGAVVVDDQGRQLSVGVARTTADASGAFAITLLVPPGTPDGRPLFVRVVPEIVGADGSRIVLPASASAGLTVDLRSPSVALEVVGGLVQPDDAVVIAWTIDGAVSAEVTGDIDDSEVVGPLDPDALSTGSVAVDLQDGDGSREVRVAVRDGAGNVDVAIVTILVNSAIPVVQLLAFNEERPTVLGVRPGSRLRFSGSATDNLVVEQRLSFFDADGSERVGCRQPITFTMTGRLDGGFAIGTVVPVPVGACAGAADARAVLIVQNAAGLRSILEQSLSAIDVDDDGVADEDGPFYFDDVPPVPDAPVVAFDTTAPPGRDAIAELRGPDGDVSVLVTPTRAITVAVVATDAHPVVATVSGNVSPVNTATFALPAAPQAFSIVGGEGDKAIEVVVEDEVGHRVTAPPTTIVLDTQRPGQAQVTATVYREEADPADALASDVLSSFFVAGRNNAVESNSRVFVFAAGDDAATAVPLASGDAGPDGAFGGLDGIDVTALGAPVLELDVVVVDRAGNRSPPLRISRPRFSFGPVSNAIGVKPAAVAVTLDAGALQGGPQLTVENLDGSPVAPDAGDLTIIGGPTTFSATLALDADDGLAEGAATARAVVAGRGPTLHPDSVSFDAVLVDVDFSGPTVDPDALQIAELPGVNDTLTGLAGAVQDLAGPDTRAVAGLVVRINGVAATVAADGSFGPVSLGANAPDVITLVVEKDAADNPGVATTMRAPVVSAIAAAPARVKIGDLVTVTFTVDDEQAVDDPVVTVGGQAATLVSRSAVGPLNSFSYELTVSATATGDKPIVIAATDASGHVGDGTRAGVIFVDADAPVLTLLNPAAASTRLQQLSASVVDVSTTETAASVRDAAGNFFNGSTFSSPTEVLLGDEDVSAGRFALTVPALIDGDDYVLRIVSVDVVGNSSEETAAFTFDVTPPVLQFTTPPVGGDSLEVPFVATIDDPDATLFAVVDGASPVVVARDGPVRVPYAVATPALDGLIPRPVTFFAADVAGNTSVDQGFVITTTPKLQLAGGDGTLCAVRDSDNALLCWGDNRDLHLGQPGAAGAGGAPPGFIPPTRIWSGFAWRKVAVGGDVVCGILDDGGTLTGPVFCVGSRRRGLMPIEAIPGPTPAPPVVTPEVATLLADAFDIAMNDSRGCALVRPAAGSPELRCWGEPLGFGTRIGNTVETLPVGAAAAVGVGSDHACFLFGRDVQCVGRNTRGQLGPSVPVGGTASLPRLALQSPDDDYDELIVTAERTCARRRVSRTMDCVGDNSRGAIDLDAFDLLGGGPPNVAPIDATSIQAPVDDLPASLVSAGAATRTCSIGPDGRLSCLGTGAAGARGDGVTDTHARAVGVFGAPTDTWELVATLGDTTCALSTAAATAGRLLCAGESGHAEIVPGAPTSPSGGNTAPRPMPLPPGTVEALAVGDRTVCATVLTGAGREVFCAGDTTDNRVVAGPVGGLGCTTDAQCGLGGVCDAGACRAGLSLIHPDSPVSLGVFESFDVGGRFGCAVTTNGGVFCAGPDGSFLGRGDAPVLDPASRGFPRADAVRSDVVQPPGPLQFAAGRIAVGDNAACVFRQGTGTEARMECWGDDLVDGDSDVAVPIGLTGVREVALGRAHGCAAIELANEVRCFGSDTDGVRGDGDTGGDLTTVVTDDDGPLRLGPPGGLGKTLATSGDTACALDDTNGLRCWGSNRHGVVDPRSGAIAFARAHRPFNNTGHQFVAVGDDFGCSANGAEVRCWGRPLTGLDPAEQPGVVTERVVSVAPGIGWRSLEAGDGFVCGITDSGVACLGANTGGVFGDGLGLVETPTEVVLP